MKLLLIYAYLLPGCCTVQWWKVLSQKRHHPKRRKRARQREKSGKGPFLGREWPKISRAEHLLKQPIGVLSAKWPRCQGGTPSSDNPHQVDSHGSWIASRELQQMGTEKTPTDDSGEK